MDIIKQLIEEINSGIDKANEELGYKAAEHITEVTMTNKPAGRVDSLREQFIAAMDANPKSFRDSMIDRVACGTGWEESAVALVDETILPTVTALLDSPELVEVVAIAIHQGNFHPADHGTDAWREIYEREQKHTRSIAQAALQAISAFVRGE